MTKCKCTTSNCIHNLKHTCDAGILVIGDKGLCNSRIKRPGGALEQTFAEIEAGNDFLPDEEVSVECSTADCVYNREGRCSSVGIKVADSFVRTKCETYIKK